MSHRYLLPLKELLGKVRLVSNMKYLGLTINWTAVVGLAFAGATISLIQADPTDDFSFSLAHAPATEAYKLMSESRVAEILSDRIEFKSELEAHRLARHLVHLCKQYRFDPAFVLSLIEVESGFNPQAHSPVGAVGLMQLMPPTANRVAKLWGITFPGRKVLTEEALLDPFINTRLGIAYLAWLRDHYAGLSPYYLVAAYNIGPYKMDQLMLRPSFKPVETKKYFEKIRKQVPTFRYYHRIVDVDRPERGRHGV